MRSDELFYECFKTRPNDLVCLIGLEIDTEHFYESITIKSTEKRLDGLLLGRDGKGIRIFFEIQGYKDPKIYWRTLREMATYHELHDDAGPFQMVFVFLDPAQDPGMPSSLTLWSEVTPPIVQCFTLAACFERLGELAGELNVLRPLVTDTREMLKQQAGAWQKQIQAFDLTEERLRTLMDLFVYAVVSRFAKITRKELAAMLQLSPIEESVAYQELFAEGREEGREEGEHIGGIKTLQEVKGLPVQTSEELRKLGMEELVALHQRLRNMA